MFSRAIPTTLLLAAGLAAQITGPTSGVVFDEAGHSLRIVVGVPGASYLGASVLSAVQAAAVAPNGKLAAAVSGDHVVLVSLPSGESKDLGPWAGDVTQMSWNHSSDAVGLAGADLVIFRNLTGEPERVDLAEPAGAVISMAVAGNGKSALVATADGVWLAGSEARVIYAGEGVADIALSPSGDLYVAARSRKEVLKIRSWDESPEISLVLSAAAALDPAAVAISPDGLLLLVADGAGRALASFRVDSGEAAGRLALEFEPALLDRSGDYFLLSRRTQAQDPVELFDPATSAAFFIPTQDLTLAPVLED